MGWFYECLLFFRCLCGWVVNVSGDDGEGEGERACSICTCGLLTFVVEVRCWMEGLPDNAIHNPRAAVLSHVPEPTEAP
jgi:hypothetical protein